jgi:hypothetical protein
MKAQLAQQGARKRTVSRMRASSWLEVAAINIAWPLALARFGVGLVTQQPLEALQGLSFFFVVVLYTLVRLSQVSRVD